LIPIQYEDQKNKAFLLIVSLDVQIPSYNSITYYKKDGNSEATPPTLLRSGDYNLKETLVHRECRFDKNSSGEFLGRKSNKTFGRGAVILQTVTTRSRVLTIKELRLE